MEAFGRAVLHARPRDFVLEFVEFSFERDRLAVLIQRFATRKLRLTLLDSDCQALEDLLFARVARLKAKKVFFASKLFGSALDAFQNGVTDAVRLNQRRSAVSELNNTLLG